MKLLVAVLSSILFLQAQSLVSIDESKIRASLKNNSTIILVPFVNSSGAPATASLTLGWLNVEDTISSNKVLEITIAEGKSIIEFPLPLNFPSLWTRLRYKLTPSPASVRHVLPATGIVAFSQIADHAFELQASYGGKMERGRSVTIHAQAIHPLTRLPVNDVDWAGELSENKEITPAHIVKRAEGFVDITFIIPAETEANSKYDIDIEVTAKRGDYEQSVSFQARHQARLSGSIQTDKPIYQPGQTLHFRAVISTPQGRPAAGAKITLRIHNQDGERLHSAQLVASNFGIVHQDWPIPSSAELGTYEISLLAEGDDEFQIANHAIRVSRYELPTFSVTAKPDRTAYLPDQPTSVTITGAYLFGKPVPNGKVKIIRSRPPHWNPTTRKYDSVDEVVAEGNANANGSFNAILNLSADHENLQPNERDRFEDVEYTAYYTDPATRRTEQRRFDIRISREAIHVYAIPTNETGPLLRNLYLTTSYADGRPAAAKVEIQHQGQSTTITTNRYGIGKASFTTTAERRFEVTIKTTDTRGQTGTHKVEFWAGNHFDYRLNSRRTLHREGQLVTLEILAPPNTPPTQAVLIEAIAADRSVATRAVQLNNHRGTITFPYQPEFRRGVVFLAWNAIAPAQKILASRAVIFPNPSDLKLSTAPDRPSYKPGENAALKLRVSANDGSPVAAAIGLAIVDQSVLERARTDQDFGQRPWFSCLFCRGEGESAIGGIRLNDLYLIKASTPITDELDLIAEALSAGSGVRFNTEQDGSLASRPPFPSIKDHEEKLKTALDLHYASTLNFPGELSTFTGILGRTWLDAIDPWDRAFTAEFGFERVDKVVHLRSSGSDKTLGTGDDFIAATFRRRWFTPTHLLISETLRKFLDYPATVDEFAKLLADDGLLLASLRDPWHTPLRAKVRSHGPSREITIQSAGLDKTFDTDDDAEVAHFSGTYFNRQTQQIREALARASSSPQSIQDFQAVLASANIDLSQDVDTWGQPYRITSVITSRYADRVRTSNTQVFGGQPSSRTEVTPVTEEFITFALRSIGPDGVENTLDDFDIRRFPFVLKQQSASQASSSQLALARGTGAITGFITDASGAVIPNAFVVLFNAARQTYQTRSDEIGTFQFSSLPPGLYSLAASSSGFAAFEMSQIPVTSGKTTQVDLELQVGTISETVSVEASPVLLQTSSAAMADTRSSVSTPRVRDYFPETLLWLPELLTGPTGATTTRFKLADTITTWKLAAFASTLDGRTVEAEADLRAFQPFFLDFAPPATLTEGDQIDVPVTVRNYRDQSQTIDLTLQTIEWATVATKATQRLAIPANSSQSATYQITAKRITDKAPYRFIAKTSGGGDAIEKSSRVQPDGQQTTQSFGDLYTGNSSFSIPITDAAIPASARGELRIYPNLASLLLESSNSILIAPHGCAEQSISAGFANLTALRFVRSAGIKDAKIEELAIKQIEAARSAINAFRSSSGGIRYWSRGEPDIAVTAYALSFLLAASGIIDVDRSDLQKLIDWLVEAQSKDGRWLTKYHDNDLASRQSILLTSHVLRALAEATKAGLTVSKATLASAYHHIAQFTDSTDEPYMLANFILAAIDTGDTKLLGAAVARLMAMSRQERGGLYWDLQSNSPFYGWGTAGRQETTALAISALAAWRQGSPATTDIDSHVRRGLVFLLRSRDATGAWHSTQSTLRAMRAILDASSAIADFGGKGTTIEIRAANRIIRSVAIPANPKDTDPILIDISTYLTTGNNQITLTGQGTAAVIRLNTTHWIPWTKTAPRSSPEFRFTATFDRLNPAPGDQVLCRVDAERIGFKGYGMMLGEVGLPPGAEVDRASLEDLVKDDSQGLDHYEIHPDRVVFYLWPRAGGIKFDFLLTPRFAMRAKSSASLLYDYYNPEASVELAPSLWTVK